MTTTTYSFVTQFGGFRRKFTRLSRSGDSFVGAPEPCTQKSPPAPEALEPQRRERRTAARRIGKRLPILFFDIDREDSAPRHGVLIDGSDGGAFIETNTPLPLLSKVRIEGQGLRARAEVCRVHWRGAEERATGSGGMAIRGLSLQ